MCMAMTLSSGAVHCVEIGRHSCRQCSFVVRQEPAKIVKRQVRFRFRFVFRQRCRAKLVELASCFRLLHLSWDLVRAWTNMNERKLHDRPARNCKEVPGHPLLANPGPVLPMPPRRSYWRLKKAAPQEDCREPLSSQSPERVRGQEVAYAIATSSKQLRVATNFLDPP